MSQALPDLELLDYGILRDTRKEGATWSASGGYGPAFERCMRLVQRGLLAYHRSWHGALVLTPAGRDALASWDEALRKAGGR